MTQTTTIEAVSTPKAELARGLLIALAVAGVILTVAVLPAEYGIDPSGAGKALGLTALHKSTESAPAPDTASTSVRASPSPQLAVPAAGALSTVAAVGETRALTISSKPSLAYRADQMEIIVPPRTGLEVKTHLAKGATLIYAWKTKGAKTVNHDFHGEPIDAKENEFESFILEDGVSESRGTLIAPFTGVHGWYWKNKSDQPVTVVLQASGFYSDIFRK